MLKLCEFLPELENPVRLTELTSRPKKIILKKITKIHNIFNVHFAIPNM